MDPVKSLAFGLLATSGCIGHPREGDPESPDSPSWNSSGRDVRFTTGTYSNAALAMVFEWNSLSCAKSSGERKPRSGPIDRFTHSWDRIDSLHKVAGLRSSRFSHPDLPTHDPRSFRDSWGENPMKLGAYPRIRDNSAGLGLRAQPVGAPLSNENLMAMFSGGPVRIATHQTKLRPVSTGRCRATSRMKSLANEGTGSMVTSTPLMTRRRSIQMLIPGPLPDQRSALVRRKSTFHCSSPRLSKIGTVCAPGLPTPSSSFRGVVGRSSRPPRGTVLRG